MNRTTMRAVVCEEYGPPENLRFEEVPVPILGEGDVLIRVANTTVHVGDVRIRKFDVPRGQRLAARMVLGFRRPKHPILGMELSGVVESTGDAVEGFEAGDEVLAFTGWDLGAYAEYTRVPSASRKPGSKGMVAHKPASMTFEEAAAGPATGGVTALMVLRQAKIEPGQKVLVYGASGSVGVWGTQLAKHFGAVVTGVCSTKNLDVVRALGADHVIDYTREDVAECGPDFDVVFDAVGKLPRKTATGLVAPGGTYLNVNKNSGSGGEGGHQELAYIIGLIERGELDTVIDRRYPWEQIVEAHRYVEQGHKTGHVVIDVAEA
jgi:NADPH:quinone reductase-like Zn-dependent oxidoreductase